MSFLAQTATVLWRIILASWDVLLEAAPYMLLGLAVAALSRAFIRQELLLRLLARPGLGSIVKAALIGIPLPLCSCAVLPTAISMRRRGASRGATVSFLVSTPQTGVDSIAVTWGLLGPVIAVVRPFAAFVAALVAGFLSERVPDSAPRFSGHPATDPDPCGAPGIPGAPGISRGAEPSGGAEADGCGGCCGGHGGSANEDEGTESHHDSEGLLAGLRYVFLDFLPDIGPWFLAGVVLAGLVVVVVPEAWIVAAAGGGLKSMILMLLVGAPIYICASASTPIAAALLLQGASPGAALVFLLAGPATNAASVVVLVRELGARVVAVYLGAIAACSVAMGLFLDLLFARLAVDPAASAAGAHHGPPIVFGTAAAVILIVLIASGGLRETLERRKQS